jgi:uncharacterized protein YndB with AHSA1/START domain
MTMHVIVSTYIDAPPDEVWSDVSEMASHAEWMADAESISFASSTTSGVGTILVVPTRVGPLVTEDWIIVTRWDEGEAIGVVHVGIVSGVGEFRLIPEGAGTRFVWEEDLTLPLSLGGRIGEVVARPIVTAIWKGNLARLSRRFA